LHTNRVQSKCPTTVAANNNLMTIHYG